MTQLIIDTNIYLNFYRLKSRQPLELLQQLASLVKSKKFEVILLRQIQDEFLRNKYGKSIYEHFLNLEKQLKVDFVAPAILQKSKHEKKVRKAVRQLKECTIEIINEYKARVFDEKSALNIELKKLFTSAVFLEHPDDVISRAYYRTLRGNPPRKDNKSFGDAIIWETILELCTRKDTILISGDGDFASEIKSDELNEFLKNEWESKSDKSLRLYTDLSTFINDYSPGKKPISEEDVVEEKSGLLQSVYDGPLYDISPAPQGLLMGGLSSRMSALGVMYKCSCCGADLDIGTDDPFIGRCANCSNRLTQAHSCSKCGRHFHRDLLPTEYFSSSSKCDECLKKN